MEPGRKQLEAFDFEEKVQVLDAIRDHYDFEQMFKEDYKLMKDTGGIAPTSTCNEHQLSIRNLKIVNQYAKMRGISPKNLFGKTEYDWLKESVPDFDQLL